MCIFPTTSSTTCWLICVIIALLIPQSTTLSNIPSPAASCKCSICLQPSSHVYLTQPGRKDGVGASMQQVLFALSFCFHHGWNYAGVAFLHEGHNVDIKKAFDFFFGNHSSIYKVSVLSGLPGIEKAPILPAENNASLNALIDRFVSTPSKKPVVIEYKHLIFPEYNHFLNNPKFLHDLHTSASCGVRTQLSIRNHFAKQPQSLTVAMHIRLGDVWESSNKRFVARLLPLAWYRHIIEGIQLIYPDSQFHIFSSYKGHRNYTSHPIDILRVTFGSMANVSLHIDDEEVGDATQDVLQTLAHLMHADVMVTSRSSFSHVSGLFNPHCVLYNHFWHHPLTHWIQLPSNTSAIGALSEVLNRDLEKCVQKLPKFSMPVSS